MLSCQVIVVTSSAWSRTAAVINVHCFCHHCCVLALIHFLGRLPLLLWHCVARYSSYGEMCDILGQRYQPHPPNKTTPKRKERDTKKDTEQLRIRTSTEWNSHGTPTLCICDGRLYGRGPCAQLPLEVIPTYHQYKR